MTATTIAPEPANVENDRRLMFSAIERARLAPSVHNTQPWIFHVSSGSIDLLSDSSRHLSTLDPPGREMTISCGAALLHLRLALQASGRTHSVQLLPDAGRPDILARIVLGSGGEIDSHASELDRCANSRQTNRRPYHGSLEAEFSDALQAAAESEHAGLQPIVDDADRTAVKVCQQAADAAQVADPAYRRELRSWVDSLERDDGVPMSTTVEPSGPSHDFAPRDFAFDGAGGFGEQPDDPHTAMFVLFTEGDSARSWMEAGQALGRLWLQATFLGLVLQPLSQSVEHPASRLSLRSSLRLGSTWPQLLLRVGRAAAHAATTLERHHRPGSLTGNAGTKVTVGSGREGPCSGGAP